TVELGLQVRGPDYGLSVDSTPIVVADGRTLDSVSTGGFLGLWLGVYGTTNGGPVGTEVAVESFEYCPA
ncbi:MAG: glycoside hydrolase family 43 protein, partial [Phenylobacterium zucineum]